jgi:hypothetical protein
MNNQIKLTQADGVQILGAAYYAVCGQVCETIIDMQANHSAQGTLLRLREELYREVYPNALKSRKAGE